MARPFALMNRAFITCRSLGLDCGLLRLVLGLFTSSGHGLFRATFEPAEPLGEANHDLGAWGQRLELKPFDPELAAAFIDRYRGRGPERRVR